MEENKITSLVGSVSRLQWACRRGMLELDVLLGNFLNEVYPHLSEDKQQHFVALLNYSDPEIYAWIMGSGLKAPGPSIAAITEAIREHARTRIST